MATIVHAQTIEYLCRSISLFSDSVLPEYFKMFTMKCCCMIREAQRGFVTAADQTFILGKTELMTGTA